MNDKNNFTSQMKETFGQYIKNLRNNEGMTLTQLGAKLDIDSANLSKIENGKRDFDERKLELLANTFRLDLEKLKTEFYGEYFAKKIYQNNCTTDVLIVAEEKVKYLREQDIKQGKLDL